jgi:ATP-dependent RNA helicase RhlE
MSFTSLGLSEALTNAVEAAGYAHPTPVQLRAIPAVLQGRDLLVAAQTGTGKTGGFALPILELLFPNGHPDREHRHGPKQPRVLVLTPTRELAAQVHDSFKLYARDLPLVSTCIFGGVGMNPQIQAMAKGVDVLVACPGRLLDLVGQQAVDLSRVEILVLDEADRMLDMGFIHDVKKVLARLPAKRQNLLFSATFSDDITELASKLLHEPERIQVTPPNTTVERIEQRVFHVPASHKRALLAHLIKTGAWEQVLVFTRTKHGANRLAEYLEKHGLSAAPIHGNKSQNARTKALADFKAGAVRILVATDIAARGLDIDQLPHVVNFEIPNIEEDYVHRIGRTGRAGRSGEAISLVAPDEERLFKSIERMTRQSIAEGDSLGFDPSSVEVEKPENRPPRTERQPRANKPQRERPAHTPGEPAAAAGETGEAASKRRKRRGGRNKPRGEGAQPGVATSVPPVLQNLPPQRDPEEFLDDEFDNFGNRADYVSPQQAAKNQKARRSNAPASPGAKPRAANPARPANANGAARRKPGNKPQGQSRTTGGGREGRFEGFYDQRPPSALGEARPATTGKQPLIIRKGERLPTLEQLNELETRNSRRERPALLSTRPSEE